ncbi:hypothetical protein ENKNEFLB_01383 [Nocardioides aquaticus]|uniref:Uncharacterized protein n=1 Tax=Nocardioides aquaticus TaxID=160826 RepID=A0ABX8EES6_9ACTN|nr:hypothetical protein ENKNEFLB_01383 [Nocardioides aquaticus]
MHPEAVALLVADHDDGPGDGAAYDLLVAALPGARGQQLGVGQPGDHAGAALGEDRGAGDEGACAGAASGLVDPGHRPEPLAAQGALVAVEARVTADRRPAREQGHLREP